MSFTVESSGSVTVIRIVENLTFVNQKEFLAIGDSLAKEGAKAVVLDLKEITSFGSMAFGLVAKMFHTLKDVGGKLVVVRPKRDEVFQVFKITRMVDLMDFFPTREEALDAVGVDQAAVEAVPEVVMEDEDPVASKISRLTDEDPEVRRYTAWALGLLGDDRAVSPLEGCLGDPEPRVREAAADSLEKLTGTKPA